MSVIDAPGGFTIGDPRYFRMVADGQLVEITKEEADEMAAASGGSTLRVVAVDHERGVITTERVK